MKPLKPIILYLPGFLTASLRDYLKQNPPAFKYKMRYFNFIISQLAIAKNDEFVPLNTQILRSVTIWNIDRYIKILQNGEFIICDNEFNKGIKTLGYKINPKFIKDIERTEVKPGTKMFDRIIARARLNKTHNNRFEPHLKAMNKAFMKLDFEYESALKWINNIPDEVKKYSYLTSLQQIKDKRFRYFKRNKTNNRLDTNLTNLKSDLRNFMIGDYVSIDLKNSQPFFLSQILPFFNHKLTNESISRNTNKKETNTHITICSRFGISYLSKLFGIKVVKSYSKSRQNGKKRNLATLRLFEKSVLTGVFYDVFVTKFSGEITRDEVKKMMFEVLFSRNEYYRNSVRLVPFKKEKEISASVYPEVYEAVRILKDKDNAKLPILLQRIESYIFIDVIAKRLVENGIIPFTIHDSMIVKREHSGKAMLIMKDVFRENFKIIPAFKTEILGKKLNAYSDKILQD